MQAGQTQAKQFEFKVRYEYKGEPKRVQIFQRVTKNFVLPYWITNQDLNSFNHEKGKAKQMKLQMIDSRQFKFQNKDRLCLLYHEKQELQEYLSYQNDFQKLKQQLSQSESKSVQKMIEVSYLWIYAEVMLNKAVQQKKMIQYEGQKVQEKLMRQRDAIQQQDIVYLGPTDKIQVGIFERIIEGEDPQTHKKIYRQKKYLLIKVQKKEQINDPLTYCKHQDEFIIPLEQFYQECEKTRKIKNTNSGQTKIQYSTLKQIQLKAEDILTQYKSELYKIHIHFSTPKQSQDISFLRSIKLKGKTKSMIKVLTISFHLKDQDCFLQNQIVNGPITKAMWKKIFNSFDEYNEINQNRNKNKIDFPFKEYTFKRQKKYFGQHYSLAFQGGGAKGLAYVGAYRALREIKKNELNGRQIPVKSIIGSSAGGIIALAVSTGVPDYQLQKICYKMMEIPSTDRFVKNDKSKKDDPDTVVPRDLYGLQIRMQDVIEDMKDLLQQYGILSNKNVQKLRQFFKSKEFEVIQQKVLNYLKILDPTVGQILVYEKQLSKPNENEDGKLQKQTGIFKSFTQAIKNKLIQPLKSKFYESQKTKTSMQINWQGILLHGAMMKGQAIHKIASEILMKFFLKMDLQTHERQFKAKLQDAFRTHHISDKKQLKKQIPHQILDGVQNHKKTGKILLELPLSQIYNFDRKQFSTILITIVNRFLVLINSYCNQQGQKLLINDINIKPLIQLLGINNTFKQVYRKQIDQEFTVQTFYQYLAKLNLLQRKINIKISEGKQQSEGERQYIRIAIQDNKVKEYEQLNSIFNKNNLIDPNSFGNVTTYSERTTLKEFLTRIFPQHFSLVNLVLVEQKKIQQKISARQSKPSYNQLKKYFLALQGPDAISQTFDYFQKIAKKQQREVKKPGSLNDYQTNYRKLISLVQKVTLKDYYTLSNIQFTCTSVDLDDKILRFFNHKCTPDLPVTRCVQMTGSFPTGFKAQRWRKQWGYYNVYLSKKTILIDLTMHEFTDGGLLANFPIKYLDNTDIRRKYFAHQFVQGKTILYGFGLDFLDSTTNILAESQIKEVISSKNQAQIAKAELMAYIFSGPVLFWLMSLGNAFLGTKVGEQTPWAKIYHKILQRIPLLRFILKIAAAYPNADRNLNLETFQNRVTIHQLQQPYFVIGQDQQSIKINQYHISNYQWNKRQLCIDQGLIIEYEKFFSRYIKRAAQAILKKQNPEKYGQQGQKNQGHNPQIKIKRSISKRRKAIEKKYEILEHQFRQIIKNNPLNLSTVAAIKQGQIPQGICESIMSQIIIETFLYILRLRENEDAVKEFNQKYVYFKFLADNDHEKRPSHQKYREKLNKMNFNNLYNAKNFEQLQKHLCFQSIKDENYKNAVKLPKQAKANRKWFEEQRLENTNPEIKQKYYKKVQDSQYDFNYIKIYDVRLTIRRLTQFLFLIIKNKNINLNQTIERRNQISREIIKLVKLNSFEKLLTNELFKDKQDKYNIGKLNYLEIIDFIKLNSNQIENKNLKGRAQLFINTNKVYLQEQFKDFLLKYQIIIQNPHSYKRADNMLEAIHIHYFSLTFRTDQDQSHQQALQLNQAIQKHEYQDLKKNELQKQLQQWGQKEIMSNIDDYFKILQNMKLIQNIKWYQRQQFFQLIFSDEPVSHFIMRETNEEYIRRYGQQKDNKKYPISAEEEQRLHDERIKVRTAFFNILIRDKKDPNSLYQKVQKQINQLNEGLRKRRKAFTEKKQKILSPKSIQTIGNKYTQIQEQMLKILKIEAIQNLVRDKIDKQEQISELSKQAKKIRKFHRLLYTDMQTLFILLKQILLLLSYLHNKYKKQIQQKDQELNRREKELDEALQHELRIVFPEIRCQQFYQIFASLQKIMGKTYYEMFDQYLKSYAHLSDLEVAEVTQISLSNAFLLSFRHINTIAKLFVLFRNLYANLKVKIDQQVNEKMAQQLPRESAKYKQFTKKYRRLQLQQRLRQEIQQKISFDIIQLIYINGRKIDNYYFCLPMFTSDWNLTIKSCEQNFREKINSIVRHQNNQKFTKIMNQERQALFYNKYQNYIEQNPKLQRSQKIEEWNTKLQKLNNQKKYKLILDPITKLIDKNGKLQQSHYNTAKTLEIIDEIVKIQKNEPYKQGNFETHLVLEGVSTSNECVGAYYYIIRDFFRNAKLKLKQIEEKMKNEPKKQQQPSKQNQQYIKAITCSNFHSIFGFLLVLGKDAETIRRQMYNLKFAAAVTENPQKVNKYFEQKQFINQTPNKFAQVLKYLEMQTQGFFQQIQAKNKRLYGENSMKQEFSEIRLIYLHEKDNLMKMYENILDKTSHEIGEIASSNMHLSQQNVQQICKKFGFKYECDQNKIHNYNQISEQSIKKFHHIASLMFKSFGQLLQGIISNVIANTSLLLVNEENAAFIMKGVIAQRLFTTYKLKEFIIKQLKNAQLSPSITLSEFFSIKRTIFLNFTVINIDNQRLEFLNKVTTPHMPVWAAVIASSSMPFYHNFFEGNKEWQAPRAENLYSFIIDEFFKQSDKRIHEANSRVINYLSGNHVSSLPLQLLTNKAVTKAMFEDDKIRYLKFFAIAFNQNYSNSIPDLPIPKNYLSLNVKEKMSIVSGFLGPKVGKYMKENSFFSKFITAKNWAFKSKQCDFQNHKNKAYNIEYPLIDYIFNYIGHGNLIKTVQTLVDSNDNFILKWYYNKVIRLPIKIGTLAFLQIVDQKVRKNYNINMPSVKAKETIERSYEITSSFINELKNEETIKKERYLTKFRVEIISSYHQLTGLKREHFKLFFLNHSKWNKNKYNNFVIEYSTVLQGQQPHYKRADESEILWFVEESSKLNIRFYFQKNDKEVPKDSKILFTQIVMNFEDLTKRLPLKDTFDYQVIFGTQQIAQKSFQGKKFPLSPTKMNGIELREEQKQLYKRMENNMLFFLPFINCQIIGKQKQYFESYHIQRSAYNGPQ